MKQVNCGVDGVATDTPYLAVDNGHVYRASFEFPNRVNFFLDDAEPAWGATIFYGGKALRYVVPELPGAYEGPRLIYAPLLQRLQPDGTQLRMNGAPWTWAMMTGFCDYALFLSGQDIRPQLQQARDLGANGRRVFGMMNYIMRFDPAAYGDLYYTRLPEFAALLASYGQMLSFGVFADNQIFKLGVAHFNRVVAMLAPIESVIIDAGNEWTKNGFNPFGLPFPGVISSQGSAESDTAPPMPGWGIRMWHGRRDYPKVWVSAEDMVFVGLGVNVNGQSYAPVAPVVHDEPIGFAELAVPNRRSTDPRLARSLMLSGRAFGAGATLHTEDGIFSRLLGPTQQACARAFFDAQ